MQVIKSKNGFFKIRLTNDQVAILRHELNCNYRPVEYAGGIMYWSGGGWYTISANRVEEDWASDEMLMKALVRKIRQILAPKEEVAVKYTVPVVVKTRDGLHRQAPKAALSKPQLVHSSDITVSVPAPVTPVVFEKPQVQEARLEALQRRINGKFHR
jgi:hypothetical protein